MYITNNLKDFGCPLAFFPGTREFVALLEPEKGTEGKLLGELLKRMENPEHDNFSPERLRDDHERGHVTKLIKKLHADIREKIRSVAKVATSDHSNLDELARLFAADPDSGEATDGAEKDPEQYIYGKARVTRKKPVRPSPKTEGTEGGAGGSGGSGGGGGGGAGDNSGTGTGGKGNKGKANVMRLRECRVKKEPKVAKFSHKILFSPTERGEAHLYIHASGLSAATPLVVEDSNRGVITNGILTLPCEKDKRISISVSFENGYDGPLELNCYVESTEDVQ